jgi:hypothetical protein
MDSGEEIPALNEDWTFMSANFMEWMTGFCMFIISNELFFKGKTGTSVPILMAIWVTTTLSLAGLRNKFPDEQRGVRNYIMTCCGFEPPGIPAPAELQKDWSGAPMREMSDKSPFLELGLDKVFVASESEES